jgi:hypothetical protein
LENRRAVVAADKDSAAEDMEALVQRGGDFRMDVVNVVGGRGGVETAVVETGEDSSTKSPYR